MFPVHHHASNIAANFPAPKLALLITRVNVLSGRDITGLLREWSTEAYTRWAEHWKSGEVGAEVLGLESFGWIPTGATVEPVWLHRSGRVHQPRDRFGT